MIEALVQWLHKTGLKIDHSKSSCRACGKCCETFGGHLHASRADLERWRQAGRPDLLEMTNRLGWIWVDPKTKRRLERCPFLIATGPDTQGCAIHQIKPDICAAYPTLAHNRRCMRGVYFPKFALAWALAPLLEALEPFGPGGAAGADYWLPLL
ncbi:hypothetical protein DESUT3_38310 [Desulfuromonas versatilis]|uniref:YkgJ family cysteine cluster protein n=1 Tax=Desulfuromonas versatilis TaxID=2802975 RepID=A0ABM8HXL1_9BACT|nr:YkgJ family cysteine cluster protein [Desulfuromonas versatilis]BCR06762.1 hypothetical protein DESUT3_38310 [Desulfuromonas versatilis]